jgi:hypothetical protein
VIEKTLNRKLERQIGADEKFMLMKVNTLGQLTQTASSKRCQFVSIPSEKQLESILALLFGKGSRCKDVRTSSVEHPNFWKTKPEQLVDFLPLRAGPGVLFPSTQA